MKKLSRKRVAIIHMISDQNDYRPMTKPLLLFARKIIYSSLHLAV